MTGSTASRSSTHSRFSRLRWLRYQPRVISTRAKPSSPLELGPPTCVSLLTKGARGWHCRVQYVSPSHKLGQDLLFAWYLRSSEVRLLVFRVLALKSGCSAIKSGCPHSFGNLFLAKSRSSIKRDNILLLGGCNKKGRTGSQRVRIIVSESWEQRQLKSPLKYKLSLSRIQNCMLAMRLNLKYPPPCKWFEDVSTVLPSPFMGAGWRLADSTTSV